MKTPLLLLIEDQAMVAAATRMVLLRAGIEVLVASSISAAVETWKTHKNEIALVISDFELDTQVTGEQLLQQFRADNPKLKSILLSGHPIDTLSGGRTEGMDFFAKPFNCCELVAAVFRLLHD